MNPLPQINDMNTVAQPMTDAKQAASALQLPYYWFSDPKMRAKYSIPHYLMGGLVRFRMSELSAWAAKSNVASASEQRSPGKDRGHDGL